MTSADRATSKSAEDEYSRAVRLGRHADSASVRSMTEAELDAEIVKRCKALHLVTFHTRDSRRSDGAGFPDRVIVGPGGVLWRELKREWSDLRSAQTKWKYQLLASGQDWALWRPSDLKSGRIQREMDEITNAPRSISDEQAFFAAMAVPEQRQ